MKKIESDSFQNNVDEIILNLYRLPVIIGTFSLSASILIKFTEKRFIFM